MDPVTHAIIGMAVSTAGQGRFALTNPVTAAAALGAVIPDGDIVLKIWGNSLYLKNHRGVSQSLLFMPIEAAIASGALKILFTGTPFTMLFFWSLSGLLSHVIFDLLNSYGVRAFWPFIKKKNSLSLIAITDPFVLLFSVLSIMYSYMGDQYDLRILIMFLIYILGKVLFRFYGHAMIEKRFSDGYDVEKIHILPSMIAIHKLHYIVETPKYKIVGEFNIFHKK